MDGLLGNLASIVKRGAFGGLLQSDEDLLKQYVPEQYLQTMTPEQSTEAAQKARGIASAALFSPRVDANERTQLVQNALLGDIAGRQQLQQQGQMKQILSMFAPTSPEQAIASGGPTASNAARIGAQPTAEQAQRALMLAVQTGNPAIIEQARKLKDLIFPKQDSLFDKIDPSKFTPESVRAFVKSSNYGDLEPIKEGQKFTGAYGNLALSMFGTNDSSRMTPEQLQGLDAEARRRQLERPASVNVNNYMGGDNAFAKKGAELMATSFNDIAVQGKTAQRSLSQINQLDTLLQSTGGGIVPQAKMIAGNLGVPVEGLSDVQAATAIINQLVPAQRPAGSGTMSDKDVDLFRQSVPRLINQPGGNAKILQTMRGIAEYDRKMGQIASDALTGRISRDQADQLMMQIPNPLQNLQSSKSPAKANEDALLKKYGIK